MVENSFMDGLHVAFFAFVYCNFAASVNTTAIRTDWETTTAKAVNYSFYMRIPLPPGFFYRAKVGNIYLSFAMQPPFTAFASVAFFKHLIFCLIEVKYMAIIIQARNVSNGGNSIKLLHLRFYVALMGSCLGFFYSENYRTHYMLLLYSFWVPQIVHNVVTEAKKPLHI